MATNSSIEWTEATWNPVAGCTVISPGCTNCYAMRLASRLAAMGQPKYAGTTRVSGGRAKWNGRINLDRAALDLPRSWKKGKIIFVNSMSDLFHDHVPAKELGLATAWINRRHGKTGTGATKAAAPVKPDFVANTLADFVAQHQALKRA